ncbi:MAG: hypothetical protein JKX84_06370 [Flavobacteriales bacterium]|nr:hypothetical protein [Flavobacteriales bacterium]
MKANNLFGSVETITTTKYHAWVDKSDAIQQSSTFDSQWIEHFNRDGYFTKGCYINERLEKKVGKESDYYNYDRFLDTTWTRCIYAEGLKYCETAMHKSDTLSGLFKVDLSWNKRKVIQYSPKGEEEGRIVTKFFLNGFERKNLGSSGKTSSIYRKENDIAMLYSIKESGDTSSVFKYVFVNDLYVKIFKQSWRLESDDYGIEFLEMYYEIEDSILYVFDEQGNWIEKRQFKSRFGTDESNGQMELKSVVFREIVYFKIQKRAEIRRDEIVGLWKETDNTRAWMEMKKNGNYDLGYRSKGKDFGQWEFNSEESILTFRSESNDSFRKFRVYFEDEELVLSDLSGNDEVRYFSD